MFQRTQNASRWNQGSSSRDIGSRELRKLIQLYGFLCCFAFKTLTGYVQIIADRYHSTEAKIIATRCDLSERVSSGARDVGVKPSPKPLKRRRRRLVHLLRLRRLQSAASSLLRCVCVCLIRVRLSCFLLYIHQYPPLPVHRLLSLLILLEEALPLLSLHLLFFGPLNAYYYRL